jgi:hypothetical protein
MRRQRTDRRGCASACAISRSGCDPGGYEEPLAQLRHAQFEVHVVQILAPDELAPPETGDLRLIDAETGNAMEVTATESVLRRYREQIGDFNAALEQHCLRRGIAHARVTTDAPFEDLVLRVLRDGIMLT